MSLLRSATEVQGLLFPLLAFVVFDKLIPAYNVFVLYISQYLTFALHFVGQGPVSMYNNFIHAIGSSQHLNGFNSLSDTHTHTHNDMFPSEPLRPGTFSLSTGCRDLEASVLAFRQSYSVLSVLLVLGDAQHHVGEIYSTTRINNSTFKLTNGLQWAVLWLVELLVTCKNSEVWPKGI